MAAKLKELADEVSSGDATLWRARAEEHLLQTTALARLLSYLAYAFAEGDDTNALPLCNAPEVFALQRRTLVEVLTQSQWIDACRGYGHRCWLHIHPGAHSRRPECCHSRLQRPGAIGNPALGGQLPDIPTPPPSCSRLTIFQVGICNM